MAEIIKTESRTVIEAIWATDWEGEEHEVLGEVVGNLRVVDLLSLKHGEQLNDQVINTYCRMLCTKNVNYIDTYILTATLEGNQELSMLERGDIEPYQLLIGCLHVNGNHWVAVGIDVVDHIFWYMDPLNFTYKPTRQMEEKVANWNNFVRSKGIQQEWELRVPSDSPLQSDSTSCGVYSLEFLENLVAHEENQNFNTNAVRLQIGVKFLEALSPKIGCHKCCWSDSSFMWRCGICQWQFHRYCKQCVGHVLEMCHLCVHAFMASGEMTQMAHLLHLLKCNNHIAHLTKIKKIICLMMAVRSHQQKQKNPYGRGL